MISLQCKKNQIYNIRNAFIEIEIYESFSEFKNNNFTLENY